MTDSLTPAPPTPGESPAGEPARPLLTELIQAREWRRALAVTRVSGMHPLVQDVFEQLQLMQDGVRSRRYLLSRKALAAYEESLDAIAGTDAPFSTEELEALSTLRLDWRPDGVRDALDSLDAAQKAWSPESLAPALAHPLTRAEALNIQGVQAVREQREADGQALFEEALVADPGHYRAVSNLGNIEMEAGRYAEAEALYRKVIALNPEFDTGHHNLGVALRRQGQVRAGVKSIRRAQQLGMRQARADSRLEVEEQLRQNPRLRLIRWALLIGVVLVFALTMLLGR